MKKIRYNLVLSTIVTFLIVFTSGSILTGCGSSGTTSSGSSDTTGTVGGSWNSDNSALVMADENGETAILKDGYLTWITNDGDSAVIYLGTNGLPSRVVCGSEILIYEWDTANSTVDIEYIASDGSTGSGQNLSVESSIISTAAELAFSVSDAFNTKAMSDVITGINIGARFTGNVINSAVCTVAVGTALIDWSLTTTTLIGGAACASVMYQVASTVGGWEENKAVDGVQIIAGGAQCAAQGLVGPDCVGFVADTVEVATRGSADETVENNWNAVSNAETTLRPGKTTMATSFNDVKTTLMRSDITPCLNYQQASCNCPGGGTVTSSQAASTITMSSCESSASKVYSGTITVGTDTAGCTATQFGDCSSVQCTTVSLNTNVCSGTISGTCSGESVNCRLTYGAATSSCDCL